MNKKYIFTVSALAAFTTPAFAAITATDVLNNVSAYTEVFSSAQILGEAGAAVDDSYAGTITLAFTINQDSWADAFANNDYTFFQLYNGGTATANERVGVGNYWTSTEWSTFRETTITINGTNSGTSMTLNTPTSFTLEINYNAGADDVATINGGGFVNHMISDDYSFDAVVVRNGNGLNQADYTAMSMTAVPEPSSTALLGLGGLALILRRRR